ncbi:MAG TPA: hypothetical protein VD838_21970, partial [Anaeromyxobacteraceae bacterium]|nr:hypothetical protein [Anaeromyxobacteraceae bacterium]
MSDAMHARSVTNARWALLAALAAMPARSAEPDPAAPPDLRPEILFSEHLYDGALASPVALTWSPRVDEFHVLDSASRLVGIFDARGYPVFAFVGAAPQAEPRDLAVDAAGRAYVLEGAARIRTFSYRGEPLGELELPELHAAGKSARIAAIALDVDGNLVVVDEALQEVLVYDLATRRIRARFGGRGEGSGRFESIRAVASDAAHYYVLDALGVAIQVFDRKGRFVRGWGEHDIGPEAFSLPAAIAAHP